MAYVWFSCGSAETGTDEACEYSADANAGTREDHFLHLVVGGDEYDSGADATIAFECCFLIVDDGHDGVAAGGSLSVANDCQILVVDAVQDH